MLNKEDRLKIEWLAPLNNEHFSVLRLLYQPLIGEQSIALYEKLVALSMSPVPIKNHLLIHKLSSLSLEAIEASRIQLEQYLLLKTFYDGTKNCYLYQLQEPLCGSTFLSHDVFGRMYLRKMGTQVYEYIGKIRALIRRSPRTSENCFRIGMSVRNNSSAILGQCFPNLPSIFALNDF